MANMFEKPVPPGSGEKEFKRKEAEAKEGLLERAAEAQKRAAQRKMAKRAQGEKGEEVDLTEELSKIAKEIEDIPGPFEETEDDIE